MAMDLKAISTSLLQEIEHDGALHAKLKRQLIDAVQNDRQAMIYLVYPFLFSPVFNVSDEKLLLVSRAGFYYYQSLIILDRIYDGDTKRPFIASNIDTVLILQEQAIKLLSTLFPNGHKFWKAWDSLKKEQREALLLEQNHKEEITIAAYGKLAASKSAMGKAAIFSLSFLDHGSEGKVAQLVKFHDLFSIGNQLLDDINDFEEDIEKGQINWLYHQLTILRNTKQIAKKDYRKALYIEGIIAHTLDRAETYFTAALKKIEDLPVDYFKMVIAKDRLMLVKRQKFEINNYLTVLKSKSVLSHNVVTGKRTVTSMLTDARSFILSKQNDDGSWKDYVNQGGISNIWATCFVLYQLPKEFDQVAIEKAVSFLKSRKRTLWAYNDTWIEDTDTSSFAILSLAKHGATPSDDTLAEWQKLQLASGGYATYHDKERLLTLLGDPQIKDVTGWCGEHHCVSAVALIVLSLLPHSAKGLHSCLTFCLQHFRAGKTFSYWWTHAVYTYHFMAIGLYENKYVAEAKKIIHEILMPYIGNEMEKEEKPNFFYVALAAQAVLKIDKDSHRGLLEKVIRFFERNQFSDGSWPESDALRVPSPEGAIPYGGPWPIKTQGVNIRCKEFNRLFTTATCYQFVHEHHQTILKATL